MAVKRDESITQSDPSFFFVSVLICMFYLLLLCHHGGVCVCFSLFIDIFLQTKGLMTHTVDSKLAPLDSCEHMYNKQTLLQNGRANV